MTDTTPVLTVRSCYASDPTLRELVDSWVREHRCPLPLVDRCLELGLESAAECARWAATQPPRKEFGVHTRGYPYPRQVGRQWQFDTILKTDVKFADDVPVKRTKLGNRNVVGDIPLGAILELLDNWVPE